MKKGLTMTDTMVLYVTSKCNRLCTHCSMKEVMSVNYQMSIQELKDFIKITEDSGYKFVITLSGGETLLWDNLELGVDLLKNSNCSTFISIYTNALNISKINKGIIDKIDCLRISEYDDNKDNVRKLKDMYGEKVMSLNRENFYPIGLEFKAYGSSKCLDPEEFFYFNYNVYGCGNALALSMMSKKNPKICVPLAIGYFDKLPGIKKKYPELCQYCHRNENFRKQLRAIKNERASS